MHFQPGEVPSRGLLRDYEIFGNLRITFISSSTVCTSRLATGRHSARAARTRRRGTGRGTSGGSWRTSGGSWRTRTGRTWRPGARRRLVLVRAVSPVWETPGGAGCPCAPLHPGTSCTTTPTTGGPMSTLELQTVYRFSQYGEGPLTHWVEIGM